MDQKAIAISKKLLEKAGRNHCVRLLLPAVRKYKILVSLLFAGEIDDEILRSYLFCKFPEIFKRKPVVPEQSACHDDMACAAVEVFFCIFYICFSFIYCSVGSAIYYTVKRIRCKIIFYIFFIG